MAPVQLVRVDGITNLRIQVTLRLAARPSSSF